MLLSDGSSLGRREKGKTREKRCLFGKLCWATTIHRLFGFMAPEEGSEFNVGCCPKSMRSILISGPMSNFSNYSTPSTSFNNPVDNETRLPQCLFPHTTHNRMFRRLVTQIEAWRELCCLPRHHETISGRLGRLLRRLRPHSAALWDELIGQMLFSSGLWRDGSCARRAPGLRT